MLKTGMRLLSVVGFCFAWAASASVTAEILFQEDQGFGQDRSREWIESDSLPAECSLQQDKDTGLFAIMLDGRKHFATSSLREALTFLRQLFDQKVCRGFEADESANRNKRVSWMLDQEPRVVVCSEAQETGSGIFVVLMNGKPLARFLYREESANARQLLSDLGICH